jgi:hypothetical protein
MPNSPKSGLRIHYRVETKDGAIIDVRTELIDMLRWEKAHAGQSWLNEQTVTSAMWVVWAAGRRMGLIEGPPDQDGWAASVVDFEVITEDEEDAEAEALRLDPTPEAASA